MDKNLSLISSPFEKGGQRGIYFGRLGEIPPTPLYKGEYYLQTRSKMFARI
jgi:hypothetical protein